ncbi:hypothetical protein DCS_04962 [Drechmeria coniospora]|uniref:Uncharacterized protein n=1 Tax=Drechmeria coniospora TaxID=98403 RepID=A0A151GLH0_DRECN|nr:hypothetical protein DCS_04962 [Drechmeria coniospora]KYK57949.1 hypothetical protein DCS_04962 [Drechmeria coniospora]
MTTSPSIVIVTSASSIVCNVERPFFSNQIQRGGNNLHKMANSYEARLVRKKKEKHANGGCRTVACHPDHLIDLQSLPIAKSISYAAISGNDPFDPAMTICCHPNPVNVVEQCVEWCQLPERFLNQTKGDLGDAFHDFSRCLRLARRDHNQTDGYIIGFQSSAALPPGTLRSAVVGTFIALFLATLF